MTSKQTNSKGLEPQTLRGFYDQAVTTAAWISPSDVATVRLGQWLADMIDSFDSSDESLKVMPQYVRAYIGVLQQLHLTVETRTQGKQEDENNGDGYIGDYLRLLNPTVGKSKSKPA